MGERIKIVVCGATGFIGRNCVERFAADPAVEVVAIHHRRPPFDHSGVRWVKADLTRSEDAARALEGADIVIQAAATTSGVADIVARPHTQITDTALIHNQVFRAAYDAGAKHLVLFSCSIMYPSREAPHDEKSFDANAEIHPNYFAGAWNKIYFEKIGEFFASLGAYKVSVIRHTNVYGPHDKFDLDRSHVFGATVTKVMTVDDTVEVWGDGQEARDLIHVDDLVDLIEAMLQRQTEPYDLVCAGAGHGVQIRDLVARVIAASGRSLTITYDATMPTIPTTIALSYNKAREKYGWLPRVGLDEGIRRTIAWWTTEHSEPSTADTPHPALERDET
jgi:GDP-L-fucose synthase